MCHVLLIELNAQGVREVETRHGKHRTKEKPYGAVHPSSSWTRPKTPQDNAHACEEAEQRAGKDCINAHLCFQRHIISAQALTSWRLYTSIRGKARPRRLALSFFSVGGPMEYGLQVVVKRGRQGGPFPVLSGRWYESRQRPLFSVNRRGGCRLQAILCCTPSKLFVPGS